jgi:hypothetical protein
MCAAPQVKKGEMGLKMKYFRAIVLTAIGLTACARTGKLEQQQKSVPSEGAKEIQATIEMGQGALELVSHWGEPVLDAMFAFNVEKWTPQVSYSVTQQVGTLSVKQASSRSVMGEPQNWWELSLMTGLPTDLTLSHQKGPTRLALGDVKVRRLEASFGEGDWDIVLEGSQPSMLSAEIAAEKGNGRLLIGGSHSNLEKVEVAQRQGALSVEMEGDCSALKTVDVKVEEGSLGLMARGQYASQSTINAKLKKGTFLADLRGNWAENATINLALKEGHLRVQLPSNVVIDGTVVTREGPVSVTGLEQSGTRIHFEPEKAAPTLKLDIQVDTGTVAIERTS